MLRVWAGLEARSFLQASIESVSKPRANELLCTYIFQVEKCVKYDMLSPNL